MANVSKLAPYLDEIELLVFQSEAPDSFLSPKEIQSLISLAQQHDLSYNVHLPIDISLSAPDRDKRRCARASIKKVMDHYAPLRPSTHTLHLPFDRHSTDADEIKKWQKTNIEALSRLTDDGVSVDMLSIETIEYPFEWVQPVINTFNLPVCIDVGHLIRFGFDLEVVLKQYFDQTAIIHLHGVAGQKDHLSLTELGPKYLLVLQPWLKKFENVLSIEVFSFNKLALSLPVLENLLNNKYVGP